MTTNSSSHAKIAFPNLARIYHKLGTVEAIKLSFQNHLKYTLAKDGISPRDHDRYWALAMTVRDRLIEKWIQTSQTYYKHNVKRVYYLSMEYLIGRAMGNNTINMRLDRNVERAMTDLNLDWDLLRRSSRTPGLGNGGLGRLAACFLDSMATLDLPGYGYGIRYEYGIFEQEIRDGWQVERPDNWLRFGNPWEIVRPEFSFRVRFGGHVRSTRTNAAGCCRAGSDGETVIGVPYDIPVAGYGNDTVNILRLWSAEGTGGFDLEFFNDGRLRARVERQDPERRTSRRSSTRTTHRAAAGSCASSSSTSSSSCSLQDIMRRFKVRNTDIDTFADKVAIQLNDTHPTLAIAELMRVLVDVEHMEWDDSVGHPVAHLRLHQPHAHARSAGDVAGSCSSRRFLPRHISDHLRDQPAVPSRGDDEFPDDSGRVARMSLIEEGTEKQVRCASLIVVAAHRSTALPSCTPSSSRSISSRILRRCGRRSSSHHERRHAAPLASEVQPRPGGSDHGENRRRLDDEPGPARAVWCRSWTTTDLSSASGRSSGRTRCAC